MKKTTIPLQSVIIGSGRHLLAALLINGELAMLLLDTGATNSVLDLKRATLFVSESEIEAVPENKEIQSAGVGGIIDFKSTVLKNILLGDLEITDYPIALTDLHHVNSLYAVFNEQPIDGILGGDILANYHAKIDYKKQILTLYEYKRRIKKV